MKKRFAIAAMGACLALGLAATLPAAHAADEEKSYHVENGKVDQAVFNGYRRYGNSCLQCHGPDGAGSSYAPNLTESLKHLSRDQFAETVINGRQNVSSSQQNVMPSFGHVEDVVTYIDDIYGYLKARSDGALPRGRPERLQK